MIPEPSLGDVATVLGTAALVYLPGVALAVMLGMRSLPAVLGLGPLVTVGVLLVGASASGLLGLPFGLGMIAGVLAVLLVVALLPALARRRASSTSDPVAVIATDVVPDRVPPGWLAAAGGLGVVAAAVVGARSWLQGLGSLATLPVEHDMVLHVVLVAYIDRAQVAAPWLLTPADVLSGEPTYFYPAGMHYLAALVSGFGAAPVPALNAVTVVLFGICWPVGLGCATALIASRDDRLRVYAPLAAAAAALFGATIYRPAVALAHDGGILPNAVALTLAPALIVVITRLPPGIGARVAIGLAAAGAVCVHPSAAVTVGLCVIVWMLAECVTAAGRLALRNLVVRVWPVVLVAGIAVAPVLLSVVSVSASVNAYPADIGAAPFGDALWNTVRLVYGYFLEPTFTDGQLVLGMIALLGVAVAIVVRGGLGLAAVFGLWVAMTTALVFQPSAPPVFGPIIATYYNSFTRIFSHVSMLAPMLAGLAVVGAAAVGAALIAALMRKRARSAGPAAALLIAAALMSSYFVTAGTEYVEVNRGAIAERYAAPSFVRVDDDDLAAIEYLATRVLPGERVMNSANDGSTYLYIDHGIPIVNVSTLGFPTIPSSYELMAEFDRLGRDPQIDRWVRDLNIAWVYVDTEAPPIWADGAPAQWTSGMMDVPQGLRDLGDSSSVDEAFRSGSVRVYRVEDRFLNPRQAATG